MCWKVACLSCGKYTWEGCGFHITDAMKDIDEKDRCSNWLFGVTSGCTNLPDSDLDDPTDVEYCVNIESNDDNERGGDNVRQMQDKYDDARRMSYNRKGGDAFRLSFKSMPRNNYMNMILKRTTAKVQNISLKLNFNGFRDNMNKEVSQV